MHDMRPAAVMLAAALLLPGQLRAAGPDSQVVRAARTLLAEGLRTEGAFALLRRLTDEAPHRLSGSPGAARAVDLTRRMMEERGFAGVRLERVMVPHWERGPVEDAVLIEDGAETPLTVCALGGSIGTPDEGITAGVVEVRSFDELRALGDAARGKFVFFNRPFDRSKLNTFEGYGGAVDQRGGGAIEAARAGGVGAIVRSVTPVVDDVPHTGSMGYDDGVARVPGAAVSTLDADSLSARLRRNPLLRVRLRLSSRTLPDAESANVLGELRGSEFPEEIIVVSGHLDAWDKGSGAHDDGAGCVQAIRTLELLQAAGLRPRRTIRAVMFMNEENGLRGGRGYAEHPDRAKERHVAAIESDRGGFAPRGIQIQADSLVVRRVQEWAPYFRLLRAGELVPGYSGVDISPLVRGGVPGFGLDVETHRYFDYHHSGNDTLDKVHPRELEMGAIVQALLCYLISEEGLEAR